MNNDVKQTCICLLCKKMCSLVCFYFLYIKMQLYQGFSWSAVFNFWPQKLICNCKVTAVIAGRYILNTSNTLALPDMRQPAGAYTIENHNTERKWEGKLHMAKCKLRRVCWLMFLKRRVKSSFMIGGDQSHLTAKAVSSAIEKITLLLQNNDGIIIYESTVCNLKKGNSRNFIQYIYPIL
jgi:hypothetical protein